MWDKQLFDWKPNADGKSADVYLMPEDGAVSLADLNQQARMLGLDPTTATFYVVDGNAVMNVRTAEDWFPF